MMGPRFQVTLTAREAGTLGLSAGWYSAQLTNEMHVNADATVVTLSFHVWAPGMSGDSECIGVVTRTYR